MAVPLDNPRPGSVNSCFTRTPHATRTLRRMHILHLTASTFFGGPERQMLGLAEHLGRPFRSSFASFPEGERCEEFLGKVRSSGFDAAQLPADTPNLRAAVGGLCDHLRQSRTNILVTHTYKPNILGRLAARRVGIPCVAVSRGWTWENLKVRVYETMDRVNLRFVDRVVAVSDGQAARVRQAGVPSSRLAVIRNAARLHAFAKPDQVYRAKLHGLFPADTPVSAVVLAAGRLSPEKGFAVLVEAAAEVLKTNPHSGFVLFGEGGEREKLEARVRELGIAARFRMPGFTPDLDKFLPFADVVVLPSFTEGLPNVALEASAAGIPVVATAVGGTPEVIADGDTGFLVPSGQPVAIADRLRLLLNSIELRARMGTAGRQRMRDEFTFAAQAERYAELFHSLTARRAAA
jgi:glycosyltransferase involved in cell wall biosynthesis